MKIQDTRHARFEDLELGTMFHEPMEGVRGMKIEDVPTSKSAHALINYVDLETGEVGYYSGRIDVEVLNATIHIH